MNFFTFFLAQDTKCPNKVLSLQKIKNRIIRCGNKVSTLCMRCCTKAF